MARKTKKEKIRSQQRSLSAKTKEPQDSSNITVSTPRQPSPDLKAQQKDTYILTDEEKKLNTFFYSDLRKSIVIIVAIIAVELVIYFSHITSRLLP